MAYNKSGAWILGNVYAKKLSSKTSDTNYSINEYGLYWPATTYNVLSEHYKNYGWWCGGNPGTQVVDRLPYANDTVTTIRRGSLTGSRFYHSGIGNKRYNYQTGYGGGSNADRIDYFNDLATSLLRGSGALRPFRGGAAGNLNYGWFGGGNGDTEAASSQVYRLDYGNDTAARSLRGDLSRTMYFTTATGTLDNGWWGGGYISGTLSTVTRVTYASDTATSVAKGNLSTARYLTFAVATSTYGWWGGGVAGPPYTRGTIVDRLTWASDTAAATVRGPLEISRSHHSGTTDQSTYGWWGGGYRQTPSITTFSTISRMDFSNDTATSLSRGILTRNFYSAATGNHVNFG